MTEAVKTDEKLLLRASEAAALSTDQQQEEPGAVVRVIRTEMTSSEKERALDLLTDLLVKMYFSENQKFVLTSSHTGI